MASSVVCDVCGKGGFKNASGLAGHKKIVHGGGVKVETVENSSQILDSIGTLRGDIQTMQKRFEALEQGLPKWDVDRMVASLQGLSSQVQLDHNAIDQLADIIAGFAKELDKATQRQPVQTVQQHAHAVSPDVAEKPKSSGNVSPFGAFGTSTSPQKKEGFDWGMAFLVGLGLLYLRAWKKNRQSEQSTGLPSQSPPSGVQPY